jgi:hypothetical protein
MIYLYNDSGELGNRLVTVAHAIAFSLEKKVQLNVWSFWRYEPHFTYGPKSWRFPWKTPTPETQKKLLFLAKNWQSLKGERPCEKPFGIIRRLGAALAKRISAPNSWKDHIYWSSEPNFHSFNNVNKHAEKIRLLLTPRGQKKAPPKSNSVLNVGVHYRRGDYRDYRAGVYFLSDSDYLSAMKLVADKFSKNSEIHFNIIGNEKCPRFDDIENTTISLSTNPGFFMDDFNSLGQNSLIIGPPSTFSGMAAFIYNKPIWHFSAGDDIEIKKWLPTYY